MLFWPDKVTKIQINFQKLEVSNIPVAGHSWRNTRLLVKTVQDNVPQGKRSLGRPRLS